MPSLVRGALLGFAFVVALVGAAAWGRAQARQRVPDMLAPVLSGSDLGFRVEGRKASSVVGRFVVRIDGQWVDIESAMGPRVLTSVR